MNAAEFSLMGVMYYGGYSLMQIPLGIVIDRKGIRKTVIWSIILCIFGTLMLTVTSSSLVAYISRFIVGLGSASAFMSSLKLSSDYLPSSKQGIAMGATLTAGSMGALITGSPLNYLLDHFSSWQMAFVVFSIVGILIFAFSIFIYSFE